MLSGILIRAPSRVVFVPGCGCVFDPPGGQLYCHPDWSNLGQGGDVG